jgi:probable F420-dependent oxidoreductase
MLLAKQLATLDFLTGGRVILGLGAGWMKEEFDLVGVPFAARGARTEEMVQLMRALWTGETVDFQGQFWQVSACQMQPAPAQGTIPVLWGGHSEHALRRVARVGDGWHPTQLTLEALAAGLAQLRDLCAEHGREIRSLIINARPGRVLPVDAETLEAHRALGVTQFVVDPPLDPPDFTQCLEELTRVAELCDLQPRPAQ